MSTKIIEVIVSPAGQTRIETKGFSGGACQEASRFLEQALGTRQEEQLTAEFHQAGHVAHSQVQEGGQSQYCSAREVLSLGGSGFKWARAARCWWTGLGNLLAACRWSLAAR